MYMRCSVFSPTEILCAQCLLCQVPIRQFSQSLLKANLHLSALQTMSQFLPDYSRISVGYCGGFWFGLWIIPLCDSRNQSRKIDVTWNFRKAGSFISFLCWRMSFGHISFFDSVCLPCKAMKTHGCIFKKQPLIFVDQPLVTVST